MEKMEQPPRAALPPVEAMRQMVDLRETIVLSKQIAETCKQAAEIAQRLQGDLPEAERETLVVQLQTLVNQGSDLAAERAAIFSRNSKE
jgi:nitrous oxidase accessory protein NosD